MKEQLNALGLRLQGEDTGGNEGRTFILDLTAGVFTVKTARSGLRQI